MITQEQLKDVLERTEALHRYLDIDKKKVEFEEEQLRTQAPDFWEDPKRAQEQMKKVKGIDFEKDKNNLEIYASLSEEEASDTAYLINEAAAWENICAILKVNHDGIISDSIIADMITKVNAAVNVARGMKTEVTAGGESDEQ